MPTKTFSDKWVLNIRLKSGERQQVYFDTKERLVLVVGSNAKTWRLLTYTNGKARTSKLGRYPDLSLKDARQKARDFADDPKKFLAQSNPESFKEVAESWVKRHVVENKLRSKGEIERGLAKYVYPKIGDKKFLDIRRGEVNALLDQIVDRHGRSQADAVLARIRSICNWYAARNEHYSSPIVRGMKRVKQNERKQLRFLNDDEIRLVWAACDQLDTFGRLVKVALLLGQRRGKLGTNDAAMRWEDISKDGIWTINAEEREKGTAHQIKLPQMVVDVLEEQLRLTDFRVTTVRPCLSGSRRPRSSIGADHGGPWKPANSNARMGRLVQQSPATGAYRQHPAGRSRGTLLRHGDRNRRGGMT